MDSGVRPARQSVAEHLRRGAPDCPPAGRAGRARVAGAYRRARRTGVGARRLDPCIRHAGLDGAATAVYGAAYGLLPIGWIIVNAVFLYNLTVVTGQFEIVKASVGHLSARSADSGAAHRVLVRRLHRGRGGVRHARRDLLGAADGPRLHAALLRRARAHRQHRAGRLRRHRDADSHARGRDRHPGDDASAQMAGRQLPFVSLIVPAWLVVTMSGWRGFVGVWPAVLVCGGVFAVVQFFWSNFVGPELVDIVGGLASLLALAVFCRVWKPAEVWEFPEVRARVGLPHAVSGQPSAARSRTALSCAPGCPGCSSASWSSSGAWRRQGVPERRAVRVRALPRRPAGQSSARCCRRAGTCRCCTVWCSATSPSRPPPWIAPASDDPQYRSTRAEAARYTLNWLSATGTGILIAALATAVYLGVSFGQVLSIAAHDVRRMRYPLLTIALMLSLGFVTRYGGTDATLGLAFTKTGWFYPFFAAIPRLARRRADRLGHELERPVRQPAEDHRRAARPQPGAHRHGQQHGRRHGQDDRRAEHRRRDGVHGPGGPGRPDPPLRLLAQRRAGGHHGRHRHAAGVRHSVDDSGGT